MAKRIMDREEWEEKYKPTTDVMIGSYEEIADTVPSPNHVWTVVDNNPKSNYLDLVPGLKLTNNHGGLDPV